MELSCSLDAGKSGAGELGRRLYVVGTLQPSGDRRATPFGTLAPALSSHDDGRAVLALDGDAATDSDTTDGGGNGASAADDDEGADADVSDDAPSAAQWATLNRASASRGQHASLRVSTSPAGTRSFTDSDVGADSLVPSVPAMVGSWQMFIRNERPNS